MNEELVLDLLEEKFDDAVLTDSYQLLCKDRVQEGMERLFNGLCELRQLSGRQEWGEFVKLCRLHPIREIIHEDPFTERAFTRPRGYPGDAPLLDYIYGKKEQRKPPEGTSDIGSKIFDYTTGTPACKGVRFRVRAAAELIDRLAAEKRKPRILSVAAGHLREAEYSGALKRDKLGEWLAFDADAESLEEVEACYGAYGVGVVPGTIRRLIKRTNEMGEFDLVYTTGLFDYLDQRLGQRLVQRMFEMLKPGGLVMVANFMEGIRDVGYMECYMDWQLIYRSQLQVVDLAMTIDQTQVKEIRMRVEEQQNICFLEIKKK